jgi:hypothetical protein
MKLTTENMPKEPSDNKLMQLIAHHLRKKGQMIPTTEAQVNSMPKVNTRQEALPDILADPMAMLRKGYVEPIQRTVAATRPIEMAMAARNGGDLSPTTLDKINRLLKEDKTSNEG